MSMITEQVKQLREYADLADISDETSMKMCAKAMREAADTIEMLSAKLFAANMERSSAYYHGGWIPTAERMPEDNNYYLVTVRFTFDKEAICVDLLRPSEWEPMKSWGHEVIAYMPIPELYNGGED